MLQTHFSFSSILNEQMNHDATGPRRVLLVVAPFGWREVRNTMREDDEIDYTKTILADTLSYARRLMARSLAVRHVFGGDSLPWKNLSPVAKWEYEDTKRHGSVVLCRYVEYLAESIFRIEGNAVCDSVPQDIC